MDLADHMRTIAANWWRILVISSVVAAGVYGWSRYQPNTYVGAFLVSVAPEVNNDNQNIDPNTIAIRVANQAYILKSRTMAESAMIVGDLKRYNMSATELQDRLSIVTVQLAGNILIKTSAHSKQQAVDEATAYANALREGSIATANGDLQRRLDIAKQLITKLTAFLKQNDVKPGSQEEIQARNLLETQKTIRTNLENPLTPQLGVVRLIGTASLDNAGEPVAPLPTRDGLLAFLVAFVIASESFVVGRALSDRVAKATDVEAITALTGLPVLALVPRGRGLRSLKPSALCAQT